jgi:predicted tellurium resistance membrane protein TerC
MQALLSDPSAWLSFLTLTALEVVLGLDNIVFLTLLVSRLPADRQRAARLGGLGFAMLTRIGLLLSLTWLTTLTAPVVGALGRSFSGRDLVLGAGGLFLLWKAVFELHGTVEGPRVARRAAPRARASVPLAVGEIAVLDIVFSIDSVLTAVGLAQRREVMVAAIVAAVLLSMLVSGALGRFVERHPTVRVLALAFLLLIGMTLVAEGFEFHIPKGYLYFAMAFALAVEAVNLRVRRAPGGARTGSEP